MENVSPLIAIVSLIHSLHHESINVITNSVDCRREDYCTVVIIRCCLQ